jgi:N utilization substance protein B
MSRREARESAFKLLFQMEIRRTDTAAQREVFLEQYPLSQEDVQYFDDLIFGVSETASELDAIYAPFLKGWKIERLPRVDLVILRLAAYEIRKRSDVPLNVSISEAVILAKRYSSEESKGYINAILGKIEPGEKE